MDQQRKEYNFNDEKDLQELQRLLLDVSDEENEDTDGQVDEIVDLDGDEEEERIEERVGDSESELSDAAEEEDLQDMSNKEPGEEDCEYYYAYKKKNKKVINFWQWKKVPQRIKQEKQNKLSGDIGVVLGQAKLAKTPLAAWEFFFDTAMLELIVKHTNQFIELEEKVNFIRDRDCRPTDAIEIRALFGLLYIAGLLRAHRLNMLDLWDTSGLGVEVFCMVMSRKRFLFLLKCLRFDDRTTRAERLRDDRLAPIRELFESFLNNCKNNYAPGDNVTVDEKLEGFRGRCAFIQYIPSKPRKYGLKIYALVDSKVFYAYNLEVYIGTQPEGSPFAVNNKPVDVVKRLCDPILNTGRNVTIDNWFTDVEMVEELVDKGLSVVGALKKNKFQVPSAFKLLINREVTSSVFGFRPKATLVSYMPKPKKNVILISSMHNDGAIDKSTGAKCKPEIITYYNKTKGGVGTNDQMCETYSVNRTTRRWPMIIFYSVLNMAGINSQVILINNSGKARRRRVFLRELGLQLIMEHLERRLANSKGLHLALQQRLKNFISRLNKTKPPSRTEDDLNSHVIDEIENSVINQNLRDAQRPEEILPLEANEQRPSRIELRERVAADSLPVGKKRKRCEPCLAMKKTRLTQYSCKICDKKLCLQHTNNLCDNCCQKIPIDKKTDSSLIENG